jgi:hypothetical protein
MEEHVKDNNPPASSQYRHFREPLAFPDDPLVVAGGIVYFSIYPREVSINRDSACGDQ